MQSDLYRNLRPDRPWLYRASDPKPARSERGTRAQQPALYRTEMLQALAHGAEGTISPRFRRARTASQQLEEAIVNAGHEPTSAFRAMASLGREYERAQPLLGSKTQAEVALVYDTEARWAFERASERELRARTYDQTALDHYLPFWQAGISVDVLASSRSFDGYALLVTPQLFLLGRGVAERVRAFVERGGIWVATLHTGYCDPAGQSFLDGLPGAGLGAVLGIENEATVRLRFGEQRRVRPLSNAVLELDEALGAVEAWESLHARGATVLAEHADENGAGEPVITAHRFGRGHAYYLGAHLDEATLDGFYLKLFQKHALRRNLAAQLPRGVTVQRRTVGERELLFVLNFTANEQRVLLADGSYRRLDDSTAVGTTLVLPPFGSELVTRGM